MNERKIVRRKNRSGIDSKAKVNSKVQKQYALVKSLCLVMVVNLHASLSKLFFKMRHPASKDQGHHQTPSTCIHGPILSIFSARFSHFGRSSSMSHPS
jgi:hypothetical protein